MADKHHQKQEALRLKTLAESKYTSSSLNSALKYATRAHKLCPNLPGLPEMLAAFQTLNSCKNSPFPEHYTILGLEPFSQISSIRSQYKKLALLLHPDKNTLKHASEEAFKLVNDAFQVLSDRVRRREYDTKLRIALQEKGEEEERESGDEVETFWTVCCRCRLMHKFERQYVGCSLVCPSCNKSFRAVEIGGDGDDGVSDRARVRVRVRKGGAEEGLGNLEMGDEDEGVERVKLKRDGPIRVYERRSKLGHKKGVSETEVNRSEMPIAEGRTKDGGRNDDRKRVSKVEDRERGEKMMEEETMGAWLKRVKRDDKMATSSDEELTLAEMVKSNDGELTLAEMKLEALRKKKGKAKVREENDSRNIGRRILMRNGDMEVMTVEDSDFYDFDKDRVERSFKKGQVWAIYDDDDGMPRHYGLIDEVVSVNPFEVKMSWLDLQSSADERMICLEKMGVHVSCGRFKVAKKDTVKLLNIFSHTVECERAARELYRIYPRKGSIWALYRDGSGDMEEQERNSSGGSRRRYDVVVFLTSYSEMHGLSMAYLEKVEGYRAVFKRREIGYHAVRWLEKDDIGLFSHQIPARKLSSDDAPHISGDCWELDPASLPPDLLTIRGRQ